MADGRSPPGSRSASALRPLAVSALARELVGAGVPRVQAVHASGVSLAVPGRPEVCYVGGPGLGLLPLHVVVRKRDLAGFLRRPDEPGQPLRLDLAGVRVFSLQLAPGAAAPRWRAALEPVTAWLRAQPGPCGLGLPAAAALASTARVRRTLASVEAGTPDAGAALRALIGRGAGSTPAGDDILVGALAHALATAGAAAPLAQALRLLAPEFDRLTTAAGATYLRAALRGSFGSDLLAFVRSLAGPAPAQVLRRAKRVATHGATSGIDSLIGFVAAHEQALAAS